MADVSIKIQLQDTIEDVIGGISADKAINNVSSAVSKNTQKNDGIPLLSFAQGYIKFDANGNLVNADGIAGRAILEGSYNGFVFGATNANGEYTVTLTITGSHIDSLIFYGDKLANQFATEAYLDGDTTNKIYSDDSIWAVKFSSVANSHTITFTKWNRANYNACFTHIAVLRNELWIDKAWLKNIESVSQSTGQPNEIFYGVIANTGNAEILDRNGELLDYITDGIIENSNLPISIWANGKQVQAHITNDSDYDTNSITLSFEMTNDFENWDSINYSGFNYPEGSTSAYHMLTSVLSSIGYSTTEIDEMLDKAIIVGNSENVEIPINKVMEISIKDYLQLIIIPYPYLEADTIKNTIDKFCTLAQLQVYKDDDNKIKFVSARPVVVTNELSNIIVIPSKCEKSQLSETKLLKNKYTFVELNEKIVSPNLDININVYTNEINDFNTDLSNCDAQYITVNYYSGSALTEYVCSRIEGTYTSGSFTVPKSSNYNLDKIEKVYEYNKDNERTTWNMSYQEYYNDDFRFWTSQKFNAFMNENYKFDDVAYDEGDIINGQIDTFSVTQVSEHDTSKSVTTTLADNNSITITERDNDYLVEYNILTEVSCFTGNFSLAQGETPSDLGHQFHGKANKYSALSLDIVVYGNKRTITFSDNNESDYSTSNNVVSITNSELLQDNTVVSYIDYENAHVFFANSVDLITNNIKDDYKNGIADATITVTCSNYYDINGNLVKDWSKGEIIQVGDIVRVDKDNEGNSASSYADKTPRLWRVTGRTFRKQGVPLIDLELQEIKQ